MPNNLGTHRLQNSSEWQHGQVHISGQRSVSEKKKKDPDGINGIDIAFINSKQCLVSVRGKFCFVLVLFVLK